MKGLRRRIRENHEREEVGGGGSLHEGKTRVGTDEARLQRRKKKSIPKRREDPSRSRNRSTEKGRQTFKKRGRKRRGKEKGRTVDRSISKNWGGRKNEAGG